MTHEDVPAVFDLERISFHKSSWTIDAFYHELEQNNFAHYFVLTYEEEVIGYIGLWIVVDQAQITTVAVAPEYRGYGLGQLLMNYAKNFASTIATVMSLEVRVNNHVAQHVYEKSGFQYGGKRKNYYGDGEDACVMWVNLND
ncbi:MULTISPECIES: ribosomal protein S18-alanine N-acetyltransferase [unclassified Staphylococcus]|uniref:ribosomal protein S18-alanine N-acetyltransferase n=1 Tax=unclassified Staphylococcus TaxID=91994 RepID=UPI0021CEB5F4|nr:MULTISPECIES: ribosomal protein S18-alanine N-acetyltransferase [unclassified Staphylococcus]UXR79393.1 ribosomal protein S18-alanine N-acetyltransferase [Staphylococcus sp. IVB6227]UXR83527.1 ribosomal protein S18-alanine N-acetyltransferase [Staphylococcus sp. IVB6214]